MARVAKGVVAAVCVGKEPGPKQKVERIELRPGGVVGDCHFGTERQVSILPKEALLAAAETAKKTLPPGTFAENILTEGLNWPLIWRDSLVIIGDCVLEPQKRGKDHCGLCSVAQKMGFCIGDRELVFCSVVRGGVVEAGLGVEVLRADVWGSGKVGGELGDAARFLRRRLRKTNTVLLLDPHEKLFVVKGGGEGVYRLVAEVGGGRFGVRLWDDMGVEERIAVLRRGVCVYRRGL